MCALKQKNTASHKFVLYLLLTSYSVPKKQLFDKNKSHAAKSLKFLSPNVKQNQPSIAVPSVTLIGMKSYKPARRRRLGCKIICSNATPTDTKNLLPPSHFP